MAKEIVKLEKKPFDKDRSSAQTLLDQFGFCKRPN